MLSSLLVAGEASEESADGGFGEVRPAVGGARSRERGIETVWRAFRNSRDDTMPPACGFVRMYVISIGPADSNPAFAAQLPTATPVERSRGELDGLCADARSMIYTIEDNAKRTLKIILSKLCTAHRSYTSKV